MARQPWGRNELQVAPGPAEGAIDRLEIAVPIQERRKRNAMILIITGWVAGFALVLLLASMAVYQFDTSRFGNGDARAGGVYAVLTVAALSALIAATMEIYRSHGGRSIEGATTERR